MSKSKIKPMQVGEHDTSPGLERSAGPVMGLTYDVDAKNPYPEDETNPKDLIGVTKVPLELVPDTAIAHAALAMLDGAQKYGPYNWRARKVKPSIYVAAARRHIADWWNGQQNAEDSGVHHLGHAIACLAILLDAEEVGKLADDRPDPAPVAALFERLTGTVNFLNQKNAK